MDRLGSRWLFNQGFGGIGPAQARAADAPDEPNDITRFARVGWVPVFWLAAALGTVAALRAVALRRVAWAMLVILAWCVLVWVFGTHQQSRFLLPTIWPAGVLLGLGLGRLASLTRQRRPWVWPACAIVLVLVLTGNMFDVLNHQTPRQTSAATPADSARFAADANPPHAPLGQSVDILPALRDPVFLLQAGVVPGDHIINTLPADSLTLLVADASVLYIQRPIIYHSAFDAEPLGDLLQTSPHNAGAITAALKARHITHVWVNWSELNRLHRSYGYDPDVTLAGVADLAHKGKWLVLGHYGWATLFVLP